MKSMAIQSNQPLAGLFSREAGVTTCRILLGLLFVVAGSSGFLLLSHPPQMAGLAGAFQDVFFRSRWVLFVDSVEVFAGVLLLVNRYVPLALTMLGAVIANILVFHITMMPSGIGPGLVATILWFVVAQRFRENFISLFTAR